MTDPLRKLLSLASKNSRVDVHKHAVEKLIVCFDRLTSVDALGTILGWPALNGMDFLSLLEQRDRLALLITAHWGAVLHLTNHRWYLRNTGKRVVEATTLQLQQQGPGEGYAESLAWVRMRVGLDADDRSPTSHGPS